MRFCALTTVGALFYFGEERRKEKCIRENCALTKYYNFILEEKKVKHTKILAAFLALCLILTVFVACGSDDNTLSTNDSQEGQQTGKNPNNETEKETQTEKEPQAEKEPEVNNIFLSKSELVLGVGETANLIATVSPGNIETTLTWSSSDNSIAEVSNQGVVTAKGEGTAVIKVEAPNGVLTVCNVEVKVKTGSISGNVTYKYNNYVGNKPDTGTVVFLISQKVTSLPDSVAYGWTFGLSNYEGVYATEVDGNGKYILDDIPVGDYYIVLISDNTNSGMKDAGALYWGPVYNMFSTEGKKNADSEAYLSKIKYASVSILNEKTTTFSYDFGITHH